MIVVSPPLAAEPDVDTRLLMAAYRRLPLLMSLTGASVLIFVGLLWPLFPHAAIVVWVVALATTVAMGFGLSAWFGRGMPATLDAQRASRFYLFHSAWSGGSWAMGPMLIASHGTVAQWGLLVTILLTACAVVMSTQSEQRSALHAFLSAALLPPAFAAWMHGGAVDQLVALVLLAGLVCLILVGRQSSQAMRSLFETEGRLRAAMAEAGAARENAEAASLAKSRFLANMSHELRTPLNAVIGGAQLIRSEHADPDRQGYLVDAIQRSGTHLLGLIENILDLSRIEAGELRLEGTDFHLVECIESAVASSALPAQAKGLRLVCIVAPALPAWRHGDAARLRQVVLNLLGNAMKFTNTGEIVVDVQPGASPGRVRINVIDTGVGIGEASLAHIFEPFRQADDGAERRFGGSGLGLAIVRQLVEAMGGTVGVTSNLGTGSCFSIELPLPAAASSPSEPAPLGQRVAFFEPHDASARALAATLSRLGCEAQRCSTAAQLRAWTQHMEGVRPWLLVATDTKAATLFLDQARDLVATDRLIGMSSDVDGAVEHERTGVWVARRIIKPVTRAALASGLTIPLATQVLEVAAGLIADDIRKADARIRILVVEDDLLNQNIVCRLLRHAGYESVAATNGTDALALVAEGGFDVVLMDCQMPDMDGLEVTRRLRAGAAGPAGREVPIVALTANAFAEDRTACLDAGMNDFLTKPVLADRLMEAVERWTRDCALTSPGIDAGHGANAAQTPVYDPKVLAALPMVADGSEPGYASKLLQMFVQSGAQVLSDIDRDTVAGNARSLQRAVHTLKSCSASVGALELAALAAAHETRLRQGQAPDPELPKLITDAFRRFEQIVHPVCVRQSEKETSA